MEELVKKIYKKMKHFQLKTVGIALVSMAIITAIISVFEGNPFPTYESDGWILNKIYLWIGVAVISIIIEWSWQIWYMKRLYKPLNDMLNEKCDPKALRALARYGMDCGINKTGRGERSAFYYFEYTYILALNAIGEYEEAIIYLEALWQSRQKMKMRDRLLGVVKLNDAATKNDKVRYFQLCENLPAGLKGNPTWLAQYARMQGKPEASIELLENAKVKTLFEKVAVHYGIAECCVELGNLEKARGHFQYAIEYGNTTVYRTKALEDVKRLYPDEK